MLYQDRIWNVCAKALSNVFDLEVQISTSFYANSRQRIDILLQFGQRVQHRPQASSQCNFGELFGLPSSLLVADPQEEASRVSASSFFQQHAICHDGQLSLHQYRNAMAILPCRKSCQEYTCPVKP